MIEIRDFRVSAGEYQRVMWRLFFCRQWPWFAVPVVVCAVLAAVQADVRWLLAVLMLLCLVFPMILVLVYINYALTLEVRWSLMEKTTVIDGDGLHLTFTDERMRPRTIGWGDVVRVTRDARAFYLHLRVRRYTFLAIPIAALQAQHIDERDLIALCRANTAQIGSR